jgi:hypothetical protein
MQKNDSKIKNKKQIQHICRHLQRFVRRCCAHFPLWLGYYLQKKECFYRIEFEPNENIWIAKISNEFIAKNKTLRKACYDAYCLYDDYIYYWITGSV